MSVSTCTQTVFIPALYPKGGKPRSIGYPESFTISALAPAVAVLFTNPFDTAKVRLQLQGQILKDALKTAHTEMEIMAVKQKHLIYKNSFDTIKKIYANEGARGLQKGLSPAILREASKNLFRIGLYDPVMNILHDKNKGKAPAWKRMFAGSFCGVIGAASCNPFELVKTRLQSAAPNLPGKVAVGHQHGYSGVMDAIRKIYQSEGLKGLYRGSYLSMGRSIVGSGTNLSSYTLIKEWLMIEKGWSDHAGLDIVCGLGSSIVSVLCMNPLDVVRTRFYNQTYVNNVGTTYATVTEAITQISKNEGPSAFYKGLTTHFLRIGPHFCCTPFPFYVYRNMDMKDAFKIYNTQNNGKLTAEEIHGILDGDLDEHIVGRLFDVSDRDKDGALNWDEFRKFIKLVQKEYELKSAASLLI